mmetsp:Transcript_4426/g.20092  ORF Transcript_4426/g.20092 Transcript_4426/m.20092 type:complete len:256 (+) Transcript_4426:1778-2545(+)
MVYSDAGGIRSCSSSAARMTSSHGRHASRARRSERGAGVPPASSSATSSETSSTTLESPSTDLNVTLARLCARPVSVSTSIGSRMLPSVRCTCPVSAGSRCSRMCSIPSITGACSFRLVDVCTRLDDSPSPTPPVRLRPETSSLSPRAMRSSSSRSLTTAAAPTYRGMSGSDARNRSNSLATARQSSRPCENHVSSHDTAKWHPTMCSMSLRSATPSMTNESPPSSSASASSSPPVLDRLAAPKDDLFEGGNRAE